MSLRLSSNIEVLEPLLLMSATAIDGSDADLAIEAVAAEAAGFDAFGDVDGEGLQAAESLFSEFAEQVGFEAQTFAADDGVADLSATGQPLQVEDTNEGFDAGAAGFDADNLNVIDLAEIDLGSVENSFGEAAESGLTVVVECPVPVVNLPPVAVHDYNFTVAGEAVCGNVLCNDINPDGDSLTAWVSSSPENGSLCFQPDGTYTYTPNPDFCGLDVFVYVVTDGNGGCSSTSVTIEVGDSVEPVPVNTAPVAVDDFATTDFETSVSGNVLANDSDAEGDALQSWVETGPENGSIELNVDGSFVYTPDPGFSGSDTFTYSVNDVEGISTTATVTLEVGDAPVNTAPVAADDYATTDFETSVSGNVLANDSDAEGDALQSWVETGPENGSIELNSDGSFVYTPNPGFSGSDTFTYSVTDIAGNCTFATVTLDVGDAPVNTAPVAVDDFATTDFETSVSGNVLANDSDAEGDALQSWV
ncbi:MAG: Ig-like domain-containing protein, partial [Fuerstiella sp.]